MNGTVVSLAPLDLAVVGLFGVAILALGFSARLRENTLLQFLAAGRRLTLPVFVAGLVSTWYGGILGIGESVSYYGLGTWLLFGLPYYVFAFVYAFFLADRVREAPQLTIPERLHRQFGARVAVAGAILIFLLAVPSAHVLMLGVLVQSLSGWGLTLSVVVGAAIGTAFLYRGGLLADARVSLLAFVMMYLGFAAMFLWCLTHYPIGETWHALENKALLTFSGGASPLMVLSLFVVGAWTIVDPGFHQKVNSSESSAVSKKGVLVSIGFWALFDLMSIGCGMYALALLKPMPENPLLIFPALGQTVLPTGLKAVFLCGLMGTILAAMVAYTLVAGATLGKDIAGNLFPGREDHELTAWSRWGVVAACGLAIVLALGLKSVVALWYAWAGLIVGPLLAPVVMAYIPRLCRCGPRTILTSIVVSFALAFAWFAYCKSIGNEGFELAIVRDASGTRFVLPSATPTPSESADLEKAERLSIGTLLPGLVVSLLIIGIGQARGRRPSP